MKVNGKIRKILKETKTIKHNEESNIKFISMKAKDQWQQGDVQSRKENIGGEGVMQGCGNKLDLREQGKEKIEENSKKFLEETKFFF